MHGALKTKPPNLHRHNDGQPEVQKCVNVWNIRQSNEGLTSSNQVKLGNQNGFDSNMDKLYMMNYMIILKDIIYIYTVYICILWIHYDTLLVCGRIVDTKPVASKRSEGKVLD
jgi:hypothetical protein